MPRKSIRRSLIVLLIFVFIFSPLSFNAFSIESFKVLGMENIEISRDTTWETGEYIISDKIVITNGATLTIEKGAMIKFAKGSDFLYSPSLSVADGRIIAEGTQEEKITFTTESGGNSYETDEYFMDFYNSNLENKASFFRYTVFENGGCSIHMTDNKNFLNTAYAAFGKPAFNFSSGSVHIENSEFKDNPYGAVSVYSENSKDSLEIVNSNFESNGGQAITSTAYCLQENEETEECDNWNVLLKNNWYGDSDGPYFQDVNEETEGEQITGDVTLDDWRGASLIVDPAIVIPGIMGSAPKAASGENGELVLDPIMHNYDNLVLSFEENGYEKDINLFDFPYEWRNDNADTAGLLKQKIQNITEQTKISKVDLVAHSMGGLISRYYIENDYDDNVDQLITLGAPHKGAPEAYIKWEAGETPFAFFDILTKKIFQLEAYHAGYDNLKDYIQLEVKSVGQLLPNYDYLEDDGVMRQYPGNYPENGFLDDLNSEDYLKNLKKVNFYNIIGNTGSDETISGFRVVDSIKDGMWLHGMPENFYDSSTDQGIKYAQGDETVPTESSDVDFANEAEEINSTHNNLPTEAQCYIIKELSGKDDCKYVSTFDRITNILTFGVFSPVDIQVIDKNGNWAGKNINNLLEKNKIVGAYYSGYDTENEFLTIPNPENGEYQIITEGTDDGNFKIAVAKISEDEETKETKESEGELIGTAVEGEEGELKIELAGDEIITEEKDTIPPTIAIQSPEAKEYLNNQAVEIKFTATDDISQNVSSQVFYDNVGIDSNSIDLSLEHLGNHNVKITAQDEAGNNSEKEVNFNIITDINSIIGNVNHYFDLNLITNKKTKRALELKLKKIEETINLLEKFESKWMPEWAKNRVVENLKKQINRQVDELIKEIQNNRRFQETISQEVKEILMEDLESIKV